jgi:tetratricopeptide (TPR) repeat protein
MSGFENTLGLDHTSALKTVGSPGNFYPKQRRLAEAEAMYQRALAGFEKALGHVLALIIVHNLSNLYSEQGKLAEAEAMYHRVLAENGKSLGLDHPLMLEDAEQRQQPGRSLL